MRYFVMEFGKPDVTLTGYLHDISPELPNGDARPGVLIFPGGGYLMCSDREAEPVALAFMAEGYQAFVLRYSVGQDMPFDESFDDAKRALHYLKENSAGLQLLPDQIAVAGFSAGGHLAASLGVLGEEKPSAMILGYPVIHPKFNQLLGKSTPPIAGAVNKSTPPAYIFTTCTDETVPVENSLDLASALDRAGVPFELHIFPSGQHGLSLAKPYTSGGKRIMVEPRVQEWITECCQWLRELWGDPDLSNDDPGLGMTRHEIGIDTPVTLLMEREDTRQAVLSVFPPLEEMLAQSPSAGTYSFAVMNRFSPEVVSDELLGQIAAALKGLGESGEEL